MDITKETKLKELIDSDSAFPFPDCQGIKAYVQDCWRSKDRKDEQDAVRRFLAKMNVEVVEIAESKEQSCRSIAASLTVTKWFATAITVMKGLR